jgi:hypothetical protein
MSLHVLSSKSLCFNLSWILDKSVEICFEMIVASFFNVWFLKFDVLTANDKDCKSDANSTFKIMWKAIVNAMIIIMITICSMQIHVLSFLRTKKKLCDAQFHNIDFDKNLIQRSEIKQIVNIVVRNRDVYDIISKYQSKKIKRNDAENENERRDNKVNKI